jgi:PAS domain S-box-containing protein
MLAFAVAGVAVLLLGISLAGSIVDQHLANRSAQEAMRLQELVNATFESIAIHADGRLLDGNRALAELAGYPLEQMIGREILSLVVPQDRAEVGRRICENAQGAFETRL